MREEVSKIIDQLRPVIQADGGDLQLVEVTAEGDVTLRVQGSCTGCGSAAATLRNGVARWIKAKVPGVREVTSIEETSPPA